MHLKSSQNQISGWRIMLMHFASILGRYSLNLWLILNYHFYNFATPYIFAGYKIVKWTLMVHLKKLGYLSILAAAFALTLLKTQCCLSFSVSFNKLLIFKDLNAYIWKKICCWNSIVDSTMLLKHLNKQSTITFKYFPDWTNAAKLSFLICCYLDSQVKTCLLFYTWKKNLLPFL